MNIVIGVLSKNPLLKRAYFPNNRDIRIHVHLNEVLGIFFSARVCDSPTILPTLTTHIDNYCWRFKCDFCISDRFLKMYFNNLN